MEAGPEVEIRVGSRIGPQKRAQKVRVEESLLLIKACRGLLAS